MISLVLSLWGHMKTINQHRIKHDDSVVRIARQLNDSGIGYRTIAKNLEVPLSSIQSWCQYRYRMSVEAMP